MGRMDKTRDVIMRESRRLLLESGYENFNLRQLAKACQIGIGTFYSYYENKDELITAIVTEDWRKLLEQIDDDMRQPMTLRDRLRRAHDHIAEFNRVYSTELRMVPTTRILRRNLRSGEHALITDKLNRVLASSARCGRISLEASEIPQFASLLVHYLYSAAFITILDFDSAYHFLAKVIFNGELDPDGGDLLGPVGIPEFSKDI